MNRQEALIRFCEEYNIFDAIGHLCLVGCGDPYIAKLVAINHGTDDYYYVLLSHERGLVFDTCVNRCQCLKDKIDEYDYHLKRFDEHLILNPHHIRETTYGYDLNELKKIVKNEGIYTSREDVINNYIDVQD